MITQRVLVACMFSPFLVWTAAAEQPFCDVLSGWWTEICSSRAAEAIAGVCIHRAPLGGVGARVEGVKGKVGNCFECSTGNGLANQGSNLKNVRHTQGIRPRTNERFDKCPNCQVMFPEK